MTLLLVFLFPTILFSMNLDNYLSVDEMMKSIQDEPEKWLITENRAIFFGNSSKVRSVKDDFYPESCEDAKIVIYFNLYRGRAELEKPKGPWYEGSERKKIIRTIKLYKYNKYKKELKIKDKPTIVLKENEKETHKLKKLK